MVNEVFHLRSLMLAELSN